MAPNPDIEVTAILFEGDEQTPDLALVKEAKKPLPSKEMGDIVWRNVFIFTYLHLAALYGFYLFLTSAMWLTDIFTIGLHIMACIGVTAGGHRLWSHRSYKAKWPMVLILMLFNTLAFQNDAIHWARDHRLHHKYLETDADPHNARRGFFFSHIGWVLCRKHPQLKEKGRSLDISDLFADPILRFQKKYYLYLMPVIAFILPATIPVYFWNETWMNAIFVPVLFRFTFGLNVSWLVNSVAHKWGDKPYDRHFSPTQTTFASLMTGGEGYHNFHHSFPWDYKASELTHWLDFTTTFIHLCAKLGWAYDLKTVSPTIIQKRVVRTGDGSHRTWGWGDKDQPQDENDYATIINRRLY